MACSLYNLYIDLGTAIVRDMFCRTKKPYHTLTLECWQTVTFSLAFVFFSTMHFFCWVNRDCASLRWHIDIIPATVNASSCLFFHASHHKMIIFMRNKKHPREWTELWKMNVSPRNGTSLCMLPVMGMSREIQIQIINWVTSLRRNAKMRSRIWEKTRRTDEISSPEIVTM